MVWVRERTIPTERPPPVGEVIANFCGYKVLLGQRDGSLRPYSRFYLQHLQHEEMHRLLSLPDIFTVIKWREVIFAENAANMELFRNESEFQLDTMKWRDNFGEI
jgi:hypothetical protein